MEIGKEFNNIISYNMNMAKSMEDKMFFINKLPKNGHYIFVDFGCADGVMLNMLSEYYRNDSIYFGYDISDKMIELAKSKSCSKYSRFIHFSSDWKNICDELNKITNEYSMYKVVLILSSVIHEVYSYSSEDEINIFWQRITQKFHYICVRDMMCSRDIDRICLDKNDVAVQKAVIDVCCRNSTISKMYSEFFATHKASNMKDLVHFLLKYKWEINWSREVAENYFPIYVEDFLEKMKSSHSLKYFERFRVPYLDKCIENDFNIQLHDDTHIKAIFELRRNV